MKFKEGNEDDSEDDGKGPKFESKELLYLNAKPSTKSLYLKGKSRIVDRCVIKREKSILDKKARVPNFSES